MYTSVEENYIKSIYKLAENSQSGQVSTNEIADKMNIAAATVTDMMKKLAMKKLIEYRKYQGVKLSEIGNTMALHIIRKHRLWEVFLVQTLGFNWDEVHEIAEQLEHIKSEKLIEQLDNFLGNPEYDPHGDPIPNKKGIFNKRKKQLLSEILTKNEGTVVEFIDTSDKFLQYLDKVGINLGTKIRIVEKIEFDDSIELLLNEKEKISVSHTVASNIYLSI